MKVRVIAEDNLTDCKNKNEDKDNKDKYIALQCNGAQKTKPKTFQEACPKCAYVVPVYEIKSTIGKPWSINN